MKRLGALSVSELVSDGRAHRCPGFPGHRVFVAAIDESTAFYGQASSECSPILHRFVQHAFLPRNSCLADYHIHLTNRFHDLGCALPAIGENPAIARFDLGDLP